MRIKVLVRTSRDSLPAALVERLGTRGYQWLSGTNEDPLLPQVREDTPDVLVFERATDESVEDLELTRIRRVNPSIKLICVSERSSDADAAIVEQGVFYYTVAPATEELEQVISDAASAVRRRHGASERRIEASGNDRRTES